MTDPSLSRPPVYLVLPSLKISGGVIEAMRLAKDLEVVGTKVGILTLWQSPQSVPLSQPHFYALSSWSTRASLAIFQLPILTARFLRWQKLSKSQGADWVFTHYATLPLALLVPRQHRWFFVQGLEWRFLGRGIISKLLRILLLWIYRSSNLLAANSYLASALKAEGLAVCATAPIWADPGFNQRSDDIERDIDILMVLRKGGVKRLDLYFQALEWFQTQAPDQRIAVITTEDEIASRVAEMVKECHVRPDGVYAMAAIYRRSRIFLHLSEHEGFALPPLEAMGCGCVPVCRNSGGPQAYMTADLQEFLLPLSSSIEVVCRRALELSKDATKWQQMSNVANLLFQQGLTQVLKRPKDLAVIFSGSQSKSEPSESKPFN